MVVGGIFVMFQPDGYAVSPASPTVFPIASLASRSGDSKGMRC